MLKDFDSWNKKKKYLDALPSQKYAHSREIWWCSLGINIGAEINGKNNNFERPVLIIKVYNKETLLILPVTTKEKNDPFHCKIRSATGDMWVKLTQIKVISSKRLLRKIKIISQNEYNFIKIALFKSL